MKEYFVYILKCADNSYYTGVTGDLEKRLFEHDSGIDPTCYTYSRRPFELFYLATFTNPNEAIAFEKQVKGWSRKKKEALSRGNWKRIAAEASCRNATHYALRETADTDITS